MALAVAALVAFGVLALAPQADAKRIRGTNGADKLKGTKKKDKIKGRGGNDKLNGRKGKDKLSGGGGNDTVKGGKSKDVHKGGQGNDSLDAVDRRADKSVSGGPGDDSCRIDMADLSVTTGCESVTVVDGGPGGPGRTRRSGGTGRRPRDHERHRPELWLAAADLSLPDQRNGGRFAARHRHGRRWSRPDGGRRVSIEPNGDWTATGLYGCTANGFLRVRIGDKSVDVPITCTA